MSKNRGYILKRTDGKTSFTHKPCYDSGKESDKPDVIDSVSSVEYRDSLYCVNKLEFLLTNSAKTDDCIKCIGFGQCESGFYRAFGDLTREDIKKILKIDEKTINYSDRAIRFSERKELGKPVRYDDTVELKLDDTQEIKHPYLSVPDAIDNGELTPEQLTEMNTLESGADSSAKVRRRWRVY